MDRSLDEIVAESQQRKRGSRPRRGGGGRPRERDSYPRDGVRKVDYSSPVPFSTTYFPVIDFALDASDFDRDDSRNLDSEWVHDKFDEPNSHQPAITPETRDDDPPQTDSSWFTP
ncbi:hypothetical protein M434DRAFT_11332 [Hypoxylon sp. CO27-5]|nr:hypothetical protein M434DRAFT_11332 [Hypoxylon sp. CO27-5]